MNDPYKILGVDKSASADEIKTAFRKLAHQHHPDKAGGDTEKFKEINAAYQVLSDSDKRQKYDQFGPAFEQMGGAGAGGFDFSQGFGPGGVKFDFGDAGQFGDIFGDLFGAGQQSRGGRTARGRDIETEVRLSFSEAAFGVEKEIKLYRKLSCPTCSGNGAEPGSKLVKCEQCHGKGRVIQLQQTILGSFRSETVCPRCGGVGEQPEKSCHDCSGTGLTKGTRTLSVKFPAGVADGDVLRVSGEGEPAGPGGRSGDLHVRIAVAPDKRWRRQGFDVISAVEVSMPLATLGGKIEVETLDGPVDLKVPAGTQPNAVFRLKGKGIPHLRKTGRGDQLVELKVVIPMRLSRGQKKALDGWENL